MSNPLAVVLERLHGVRPLASGGYQALCPVHGDEDPSLSVGVGDDGRILLYCHANCSFEQVVSALGLTPGDLHGGNGQDKSRPDQGIGSRIVAAYEYRAADGNLLYQVVRYHPKAFRQRRPDGQGGWVWNTKSVPRVLYRLPELLAESDRPVYVVEGEKDCDRLAAEGLLATCSPGGAGKWRAEYAETLRGRDVLVIPDNDPLGQAHAQDVAWSLHGVAASVKVVALPGLPAKGDLSTWVDDGHTVAELEALTAECPEWEPTENVPSKPPVKVWGLGELLAAGFPEPVWIVPELLPAGLALLAGRPKLGKSFLALQLALAVGAGGRFLGRSVAQGRALYIAFEDSEDRIQRRLRDMGALSLDGLSIAFGWPALNSPEGLDALAEAIRSNGLRLLVIDTLARAIRGRLDWDRLSDVTALLGPLQELASATGCCILLVDHHRKGGGQGADVVDDVMGSTGKSAICDTVLGLYRRRGDKGATLAITGRDVEEGELAIAFDPLTRCWQPAESAEGVRAGSVQDAVFAALEALGEATISQLADALGKDTGNLYREVTELVAKGVVVRGSRRGRSVPYRLASALSNEDDKRHNLHKDNRHHKHPGASLSSLSSSVDTNLPDGLTETERHYRDRAEHEWSSSDDLEF